VGIEGKILERLGAREKKEGSLPKTLEFYRRLLRIQSEARFRIGEVRPELSQEAISDRLGSGRPLLEFGDLAIDWQLAQGILEEVTALFRSYPEISTEMPADLKDSLSSPGFLKEAVRTWFEGAQSPPRMAPGSANEAFLDFLIPAIFKPFLVGHREALLGFVNQELWRRGYCPICGGSPDFAFLDRERGSRWLMCSRCDAEWLFQRLECPNCGTQDQDALAYFTDDKGLYRLYVCEACRQYLKAIDSRLAADEVLLPLERFLTLDIDIQARTSGYGPNDQTRKVEPSPNC